jgi:outer membrane receptor protein involved in Fe transport
VVYIDPLNRRAGNPRLRPQDTHSYELGWQYRRQQTYYLATLYYRDSSDASPKSPATSAAASS